MRDKESIQLSPRSTLASDVADALREAIVSGHFEPGERIIESSLADELEISRSTLREAMRVLGSEGLITTEPHRGSQVTDITAEDLREVYEMRLALESLAVSKVCGALNQEQAEALRTIVARMRQSVQDGDILGLNELDMLFHETICRFADNGRLWKTWKQMGGQMRLYFAAFKSEIQPDEIPKNHELILTALVDGDPDHAQSVLRDHINDAAQRILDNDSHSEQDAGASKGGANS